jgi:hypothetical protein
VLPIASAQQAVYDALLAALAPVPVLDDAGVNQSYPYVSIGEFIAGHADTLTDEAADLEITIHVWSRQPGMQECSELMEAAKAALHRVPLAIADAQWVDTIWNYAQTLRDPDGKTRHGILRFRILTFAI